MMFTYQLVEDKSVQLNVIKRSDNIFIPMNPDNTDYQTYLAWVAEGNTPEGAAE